MFTFVNSSYSFYWDVTKDWDLTLLTSSRRDAHHPYGLRRHRHFADRQYYLAILVDLAIRFSWLSRFMPGFVWLCETEVGIWLLMFLEVARRWMWIFLRVETESGELHFAHVRTLGMDANLVSIVRNSRGPAPDDILLGEFNGKLDAD